MTGRNPVEWIAKLSETLRLPQNFNQKRYAREQAYKERKRREFKP